MPFRLESRATRPCSRSTARRVRPTWTAPQERPHTTRLVAAVPAPPAGSSAHRPEAAQPAASHPAPRHPATRHPAPPRAAAAPGRAHQPHRVEVVLPAAQAPVQAGRDGAAGVTGPSRPTAWPARHGRPTATPRDRLVRRAQPAVHDHHHPPAGEQPGVDTRPAPAASTGRPAPREVGAAVTGAVAARRGRERPVTPRPGQRPDPGPAAAAAAGAPRSPTAAPTSAPPAARRSTSRAAAAPATPAPPHRLEGADCRGARATRGRLWTTRTLVGAPRYAG